MARTKRPKRRRPETLIGFVSVTEVKAGLSVHAAQERGEQAHIASTAHVELTGTMDEPVRNTRDVEIVLYPAEVPTPGTEPVPWIGLVHGVRPVLRPAVFLPHREFDHCVDVGALRPAEARSHGAHGIAAWVGLCGERFVLDAPGGVRPIAGPALTIPCRPAEQRVWRRK